MGKSAYVYALFVSQADNLIVLGHNIIKPETNMYEDTRMCHMAKLGQWVTYLGHDAISVNF